MREGSAHEAGTVTRAHSGSSVNGSCCTDTLFIWRRRIFGGPASEMGGWVRTQLEGSFKVAGLKRQAMWHGGRREFGGPSRQEPEPFQGCHVLLQEDGGAEEPKAKWG